MDKNKTIVLQSFDNSFQANLIKSKLEDSGITCFLTDEITSSINPVYGFAIGGIKLNISEKDYQYALSVLFDSPSDRSIPKDEIITCPKCKSMNISIDNPKKIKFFLFRFILSLFFFFPLKPKRIYHCNNCENEFRI
ncbi:MAG: DUF2007 domain-containing protein [FCB group bacterium]|jgi:DNA-directed RNA polymerase subunit RPC12/RpoP